jgi:hypothetical protein
MRAWHVAVSLVLLARVASASPASADDEVPRAPAAAETPPAPLPPRAHQAVLMPTALTQPALTFSVDLNGVMPGLTFTPVSFLQLQVAGFAGVAQFAIGFASLKAKFLDTTHVKAAAFGDYVGYTFTGSNEGRVVLAGAVVTACGDACRYGISVLGGIGKHGKTVDTSPSSNTGTFLGVNAHVRLAEQLALVAEVNRLGERAWQGGGALRWSRTRFGLDVGAVFLSSDELPVLPWVALSYSLALAGH